MKKWILVYSALACGCVALLLLIIWALGGLTDMAALSHDGLVALILAVTVTVLLSVVLMGLSFYSARHGHDDKVMEGDSAPYEKPPPRK